MFDFYPPDAKSALLQTRVFWAASIIVQPVITAILLVMCADLDPSLSVWPCFPIAATAGWVLMPTGFFFRNQIYKRHWQGHAVTPRGYLIGNVFLQGVLEAITLFVITVGVLCDALVALLIVATCMMALQLVNFPSGRMMQPRQPDIADCHQR